jgi:hypothetical protein
VYSDKDETRNLGVNVKTLPERQNTFSDICKMQMHDKTFSSRFPILNIPSGSKLRGQGNV